MKLSEAIMMNGMTKPQGFGGVSMYSFDAPCALGGALQMIGEVQDYYVALRAWPWIGQLFACPEQNCSAHMCATSQVTHLNDGHRWTRAQISEWVASVEPKEEVPQESPQAELVSSQIK